MPDDYKTNPAKREASIYAEVQVYDPRTDPYYIKVGGYVKSSRINISMHDGDSDEPDQPLCDDQPNLQVDAAKFFQAIHILQRATQS